MDFKRFLLILAIIGTLGFYLMQASQLNENAQWGVVGLLLAEFILLLFMPGANQVQTVRRPRETKSTSQSVTVEESGDSIDVPEPVTEASLDGATLKERKMAKLKAKEETESVTSEDEEDDIPEVSVEVEEVHVAEQYVVEVDAQSIEDADIEDTVEERRERHSRIRERIEDRRRSQMAEIRASTAKMWESQDEGEDIIATLSQADHGLMMLEEPAKVEPGHPYGSTFIRIDESRVLRLRTPLDSGFHPIESAGETELPALGDLPPPLGLPGLDDLPPPPGLPLPPPPSPAQSALADIKADINNED